MRAVLCVLVSSSIGVWTANAAAAQAGGAGRPARVYDGPSLTMREAVDRAMAAHPDLTALRAEAEVARVRPLRERSLMPPMIEGQIFQWPFDTANPADAQVMLMIAQAFPGKGKRDLRAASAEKAAAVAANEVAIRGSTLAAEVRRAYADLYLARESLAIFDAATDLLRQVVEVAEAKYATGRITQQDIVKTLVEIARVEEQIVMATEDAGMAEAKLNTLLDRDPDAPIGPLAAPDAPLALPGAADARRLASEEHPGLHGIDLEASAREAAVAVAESETKPDWIVKGGYMFMPNMVDAWTASVGLTWPGAPWARKRVDAETLEARRMTESTEARRRALESRISQMVQESLVKARAAVARADLIKTSVIPQLEHSLDIALAAYQTDRLGFTELLDTERMLLDARLDYYRALNRRDIALADLDEATGAAASGPEPAAAQGSRLPTIDGPADRQVRRIP